MYFIIYNCEKDIGKCWAATRRWKVTSTWSTVRILASSHSLFPENLFAQCFTCWRGRYRMPSTSWMPRSPPRHTTGTSTELFHRNFPGTYYRNLLELEWCSWTAEREASRRWAHFRASVRLAFYIKKYYLFSLQTMIDKELESLKTELATVQKSQCFMKLWWPQRTGCSYHHYPLIKRSKAFFWVAYNHEIRNIGVTNDDLENQLAHRASNVIPYSKHNSRF